MAVFIVTGKLGSGKNLCTVARLRDYFRAGRPVATNIDLDVSRLVQKGHQYRGGIVRLPDFPSSANLADLGEVDTGGDETKNGGLFLDECGVLFNSREWGDKDRQALVDWLLHSRKLGWDVYLVVQNISLIDKQMRDALAEHVVYCKRWDRVAVPIFGTILRLCTFGLVKLKLPRIHTASIYYGQGQGAAFSDSWHARGTELFGIYPTRQLFSRRYEHGPYSPIPNAAPFRPTGWIPPDQAARLVDHSAHVAAWRASPTRGKRPEVAAVMSLPPAHRIAALRALAHT